MYEAPTLETTICTESLNWVIEITFVRAF